MDWDDPIWDREDDWRNQFEPITGRIVGETKQAYKVMGQDLGTFFVPKSVSQEDGTGGLVVQNWFIEKEGLEG